MIGISCPWCESEILLAAAELSNDTVDCPECRTSVDLGPGAAADDTTRAMGLPLAA